MKSRRNLLEPKCSRKIYRLKKALDFTSNTSLYIYHDIYLFRAHFSKHRWFIFQPKIFPPITQDKDIQDILVFFITFLYWWRGMLVMQILGPIIGYLAPSCPEDMYTHQILGNTTQEDG